MDVANPDKVGWLTKQGGLVRNWKKRWFVLKNNQLYYYRGKTDTVSAGVIDVETAGIENGDKKTGKRYCIEVSTNGRNYYIHADNQTEYDEWVDALAKKSMPLSTPTLVTGTSDDIPNSLRRSLVDLINAGAPSDTIVVGVQGMHCERCVQQLHFTLSQQKAITTFNIDIEKAIVSVSGKVNINELLGSIEQFGFIAAI